MSGGSKGEAGVAHSDSNGFDSGWRSNARFRAETFPLLTHDVRHFTAV